MIKVELCHRATAISFAQEEMAYAFSGDAFGREIIHLAAKILSTIKLIASLAKGVVSIFLHLSSWSILVYSYNNALFLIFKLMEQLICDAYFQGLFLR